jgi:hypothetical protein
MSLCSCVSHSVLCILSHAGLKLTHDDGTTLWCGLHRGQATPFDERVGLDAWGGRRVVNHRTEARRPGWDSDHCRVPLRGGVLHTPYLGVRYLTLTTLPPTIFTVAFQL